MDLEPLLVDALKLLVVVSQVILRVLVDRIEQAKVIRIGLALLVDAELLIRADRSRYFFEFNAGLVLEAPRLVVGLQLAVVRILYVLEVVIVGSYAESDHQAFIGGPRLVCGEITVLLADHDCSTVELDKLQKLHHGVEDNSARNGHREAHPLYSPLVSSAIGQSEVKRLSKLVQLDQLVAHAAPCGLLPSTIQTVATVKRHKCKFSPAFGSFAIAYVRVCLMDSLFFKLMNNFLIFSTNSMA